MFKYELEFDLQNFPPDSAGLPLKVVKAFLTSEPDPCNLTWSLNLLDVGKETLTRLIEVVTLGSTRFIKWASINRHPSR